MERQEKIDSRLGFIGRERDFESDYFALGARMCDAETGRFLSVDPLFESFDAHTPYHYAYNSPIKYKDPSGLATEKEEEIQEMEIDWETIAQGYAMAEATRYIMSFTSADLIRMTLTGFGQYIPEELGGKAAVLAYDSYLSFGNEGGGSSSGSNSGTDGSTRASGDKANNGTGIYGNNESNGSEENGGSKVRDKIEKIGVDENNVSEYITPDVIITAKKPTALERFSFFLESMALLGFSSGIKDGIIGDAIRMNNGFVAGRGLATYMKLSKYGGVAAALPYFGYQGKGVYDYYFEAGGSNPSVGIKYGLDVLAAGAMYIPYGGWIVGGGYFLIDISTGGFGGWGDPWSTKP